MESRKQNVNDREELEPLLKARLNRITGGSKHSFIGIHTFTPSADVPDEYGNGPRLVILPPNAAYSKGDNKAAFAAALEILQHRGDQPRQKQNRLIFLAGDYDVVGRLKDQGRTVLAWKGIVADIDSGKLNLDLFQIKLAKKNADSAEKSLVQLVRETWKWLLCPVQEVIKGKPEITWDVASISPAATNLVLEIEQKLHEEEWLITRWSPIHLRNILHQWYFKEGVQDISAQKVWQDCCHYLYLPRIANQQVFQEAISQGLESEDYFGFAAGKEEDRYLGFAFAKPAIVTISESSYLIEREAALAYRELTKPKPPEPKPDTVVPPSDGTQPDDPLPPISPAITAPPPKTRFYGTTTVDPLTAKIRFSEIIDEVVEQFSARTGVTVSISIEIEAETSGEFDEALQRAIKENCNTLRFGSSEFE
jgi:hypothetical protein